MANEPQDLTLAEKAEYKWLTNTFRRALSYGADSFYTPGEKGWYKHIERSNKRRDRLEELERKKAAYEEYQKSILNK